MVAFFSVWFIARFLAASYSLFGRVLLFSVFVVFNVFGHKTLCFSLV